MPLIATLLACAKSYFQSIMTRREGHRWVRMIYLTLLRGHATFRAAQISRRGRDRSRVGASSRITVTQGGFGAQLNIMHGWLNMHASRGNFAIHSAPNERGMDAAFLYFVDIGVAKAFVKKFACGLAMIRATHEWRT